MSDTEKDGENDNVNDKNMSANLGRIRAVRAGNRGVTTKLIKEAEFHVSQLNEPQGKHDIERMQTISTILSEKKDILKELDEKIVNLCDIDDIPKEIEEADEYMFRILDIQRILAKESKVSKPKPTEETTQGEVQPPTDSQTDLTGTLNSVNLQTGNISLNASGITASTNENMQNSSQIHSKLPKLTLPKFKGDITQFRSFWDSFTSAVHNNPKLSIIDKFNYLNSLLEGRALRAIQGLPITEDNYQSAVDILNQRFGKSQAIISAHMEELMKIPACTGEKSSQLRYLYDKISVHIRGLDGLGVTSKQYGSLLIPVIMAKLPAEVRVQIARNTTEEVWEISDMMKIILKEVEAREVSESIKANEIENRKPRTPAAAALATQGSLGQSIQCVYCKEHHFSASCDRVTATTERREILKRDRRCFTCLGKNHRSSQCDPKRSCRRCGGKHHQSICERERPPYNPKNQNNQTPSKENTLENNSRTSTTIGQSSEVTTTAAKTRHQVLLQTAVTYAKSPNGTDTIPVRVLLDSGSQRSYITNSLKKRLGLPTIKTETLNLNTFGNDNFSKQQCDMVQLSLKGRNGDRLITALCFPKICSPLTTTIDLNKYPHLQHLNLSDLNIVAGNHSDSSIDILIGADYYFNLVNGEIVRGDSGLVAMNSEFGWIVCGPTADNADTGDSVVNLLIERQGSLAIPGSFESTDDESELTKSLHKFWEIESMGICEEQKPEVDFLQEIQFNKEENRYEVKLPWKVGCVPKSNGYAMCVKRLHQLHTRLKNDKSLLHEYDKVFKEQEEMGIIEPVVQSDETSHFLPHHAVVRQDKKTTKVRVVFDGSAKSSKDDLSLNDCLEKGPNLVPHLFDTIVKFRGYPVGLVADVEKAFHQILIAPDDRRMLRFLWFDDVFKDNPTIKQFQFRRLPFGITPSPAILSTTIHHHLSKFEQKDAEIASLLLESLYVDDFAGGAYDDDQAEEVYNDSQHLMSTGGFKLRKWHSNSAHIRDIIATASDAEPDLKPAKISELSTETKTSAVPKENVIEASDPVSPSSEKPSTEQDCYVKILGLNWNVKNDEFYYDLEEMIEYAQSLPPTKRSVLKLSAKVFDPIGFVTPFTVNMKMLFQRLCTSNVNWDDPLEGEQLRRWNLLVKEFRALVNICVPRCYFQAKDNLSRTHQLHGFCDASNLALAAVVYLRTEHSNGEVETILVASKTRVAPMKKQTTPRLELLSALVLARLIKSIVCALKSVKVSPEVILWTDSFTALCWIRNNRAWKSFIQSRVKEIRELTSEYEWRHCPGAYNPADLPSRGCTGSELAECERWWKGPLFLIHPPEEWPVNLQPARKDYDQASLELMKNPPSVTHALSGVESNRRVIDVEKIIDIQRYSSRIKLLRVTARVLRFLKRARKKPQVVTSFELAASELNEAELLWIHSIQSSAFAEEKRCIHSGRFHVKVKQLGMFVDNDEIIRCEGRISASSAAEPAKQPILLPQKHTFTEMIVRDCHEIVHHDGIRETLNCVRAKYWILRGRETVKRIVRKCVTCKKFEGKPFATPKDPPLPESRVSDEAPFTNTGVDFAGPLYVSNKQTTQKTYVCLFTCASTRAVHLELVDSLNVPSFLQAFRRFSSRRGLPTRMLSDNAKTFKCASKEVKNILRSVDVQRELASKGICWDFIIEKAPWHGGFWERMVKSVKRCLKKSLGRTSLDFEALRTLLVEIETTINNRPLTYLYDDEEGVSYPLTPSQLIYGRQIALTPNNRQFAIASTNQTLTKRAKHHSRLLKQFTKRWRNEYLLSIRETARCINGNLKNVITEGDIVVLKNDSSPRAFWRLAKITELLKSHDGIIRAARVRVVNSESKVSELRRPVQHLIPLELRIDPEQSDDNVSDSAPSDTPQEKVSNPVRRRPRRNAAIVADILRKGMR